MKDGVNINLEKIKNSNKHKYIDSVLYKKCTKCAEWIPCNADYFYSNKSNRTDGLIPYCKACAIRKSMKWKEDNPEKRKENYRKTYYRRKIYNPDHQRNMNRQRVKNGKHKEWCDNNKDKIKMYNEKSRNKKHDISKNEWISCKEYFHNRCAYCSKTESEQRNQNKEDFHREHVDHNGANDLSNCIPACTQCNTSKHDHEFQVWYNGENPKFNSDRLNQITKWLNEDYKLYIKEKQNE